MKGVSQTKKCKYCRSEIDDKATVCPYCKRSQINIGCLTGIVILLLALLFLIIGAVSSGEESASGGTDTGKTDTAPIEYTVVDLKTMLDELDANALKAERDYQNAYIEFTGDISVIDSDGDYIAVCESGNRFTFKNITCYIKNDAQLDVVLTKSVGDTVTVKGKIKSIGEVLGYTLDIDSIQ